MANGLFDEGRAAWPELALSPEALAAHLARIDAPERPHVELYLACACAHGDSGALEIFERTVLSEVGAFVRRIDAAEEFAQEVRQALRERLLLRRDELPPRIADYTGRGPLGAWVRVAAVRVALDLKRAAPRASPLPSGSEAVAPGLDPEMELLRRRYRGHYEEALRAALAMLDAKERNLLRLHIVDGVSLERIAVAYRVHRATAARWAAAARDRLLAETYRRLGETLPLSRSELHSLAAVVQSQLHLSLTSFMKG